MVGARTLGRVEAPDTGTRAQSVPPTEVSLPCSGTLNRGHGPIICIRQPQPLAFRYLSRRSPTIFSASRRSPTIFSASRRSPTIFSASRRSPTIFQLLEDLLQYSQ